MLREAENVTVFRFYILRVLGLGLQNIMLTRGACLGDKGSVIRHYYLVSIIRILVYKPDYLFFKLATIKIPVTFFRSQ